jgi:excisionase family DNA binding protein
MARSTAGRKRSGRYDPVERLLLKPEEAADVLGVSKSMVYELIRRGELACVRVGSSVRVAVAAIEDFIARGGSRRASP